MVGSNHCDEMMMCRSGRCVLLVDDNPILQELGKECFSIEGVSVDFAENGSETLEKVSRDIGKYDMILMDVEMRSMNGPETLLKLREGRYHRPVIAMTQDEGNNDKARCLGNGFTDYLAKPYELEDLASLVNQYLSEVDK